jgi:putative transposase
MTLSKSDLIEVLESIKAGGDVDLIRRGAEMLYQALIEAEATEQIRAGRFERSGDRVTQRNGHRSRLLTTKAGDLELKIPKLREASFFPSLLERRRRIDRALFAVVMEAYVHGVSTRKVDDLVGALGGRRRRLEVRGESNLRAVRRRDNGLSRTTLRRSHLSLRLS